MDLDYNVRNSCISGFGFMVLCINCMIKFVMCKLILTKKNCRSLNVYEIEVILPSNLTEDLFEENKSSEKRCYSLIIYTYFLVVDYKYVLRMILHKLSEWTICLSKLRCYGDCMLLVKKTDVNSKNKQDPQPIKIFFV